MSSEKIQLQRTQSQNVDRYVNNSEEQAKKPIQESQLETVSQDKSTSKTFTNVPDTQFSDSNESSTSESQSDSCVNCISDTSCSDDENDDEVSSLVAGRESSEGSSKDNDSEEAENERYMNQIAAIYMKRKRKNILDSSQEAPGDELSKEQIINLNNQRQKEISQLQDGAHERASQYSHILATQLSNVDLNDVGDKDQLEQNEEESEAEKLLLPDSFLRLIRSSSREDFISRRLRREEFLALKFETYDKTYGKVQYDHFKVPSNINLCGSCFHEFDETEAERQEVTAVCGHRVCRRCRDNSAEEPCANCELFTEYRNDPLPLVKLDENETRWLFDDIKDDRKKFQGTYWFEDKIKGLLKYSFGLSSFRPCQREIVNAMMQSHNVFVLMASGGGKSLTYQLPALLCSSFYLVVSPIVSLMHDQVRHLREMGIASVAIDIKNYNAVMADLRKQCPITKIVYISPERLLNDKVREDFRTLATEGRVARIVFDEAHCIYQWGIDFRHSYLYMDQILKTAFSGVPVALYSASITPSQRQTILKILDMDDPKKHIFYYFMSSFDRPNLHYRIEKIGKGERNKFDRVLEICESWQFRNCSGLVYCNTRNECDRLAEFLIRKEVTATAYHANVADDNKLKYQENWMKNRIRVMVCTVAFGLGINKPDVRFVIHYSMPKNLEGYFQETGRAGRDKKYAACFLLCSPNDRIYWKNMIESCYEKQMEDAEEQGNEYSKQIVENNRSIQYEGLDKILTFVDLKVPSCHREFLLRHFGQHYSRIWCEYNLNTACDLCRKTRFKRDEIGLVKRINDKYKRDNPQQFYEHELRDIPDDLSD